MIVVYRKRVWAFFDTVDFPEEKREILWKYWLSKHSLSK